MDGNPAWLSHPDQPEKIDIAIFPLTSWPESSINIALGTWPEQNIPFTVGIDVFVIGYPEGIERGLAPIWKRGSLAVDPDTASNPNEPNWLIDCASRPGLSGSPVIIRRWSPFEDTDGRTYTRGHGSQLIGIYSGRYATSDDFGAHLGIVWPRKLIDEIIDGSKFDNTISLY